MLVLSMQGDVQMAGGSDCEQRGCRVSPGIQQAGTWLKNFSDDCSFDAQGGSQVHTLLIGTSLTSIK